MIYAQPGRIGPNRIYSHIPMLNPVAESALYPTIPTTVDQLAASAPDARFTPFDARFSGGDPGDVLQLPIDESRPDGESILAWLFALMEYYSRDHAVRVHAIQILNDGGIRDAESLAGFRLLLNYAQTRMIWIPDPQHTEHVTAPPLLLDAIDENGEAYGDCDDHVVLLGSMLMSVGIEARPVAVKLDPGRGWYDHVILQADVDGDWRDADPCAKGIFQPSYSQRMETPV